MLALYVNVWAWLVCLGGEASEEAESEESNYEHVIVEASYLAYEWSHVSHQFTHLTAMFSTMVEGWWL